MLLALAKPRFSEFRMSLNSGKSSATSSGVPSVEALSTTITSEHARAQCRRRVSRHSITYFFAFHTTMTTDTRGAAIVLRGELSESKLERQLMVVQMYSEDFR